MRRGRRRPHDRAMLLTHPPRPRHRPTPPGGCTGARRRRRGRSARSEPFVPSWLTGKASAPGRCTRRDHVQTDRLSVDARLARLFARSAALRRLARRAPSDADPYLRGWRASSSIHPRHSFTPTSGARLPGRRPGLRVRASWRTGRPCGPCRGAGRRAATGPRGAGQCLRRPPGPDVVVHVADVDAHYEPRGARVPRSAGADRRGLRPARYGVRS
jgi:hypothetical protein